jgi:hypothetical protein
MHPSNAIGPFMVRLVAHDKVLVAANRTSIIICAEVPVSIQLIGIGLFAADGAGFACQVSSFSSLDRPGKAQLEGATKCGTGQALHPAGGVSDGHSSTLSRSDHRRGGAGKPTCGQPSVSRDEGNDPPADGRQAPDRPGHLKVLSLILDMSHPADHLKKWPAPPSIREMPS